MPDGVQAKNKVSGGPRRMNGLEPANSHPHPGKIGPPLPLCPPEPSPPPAGLGRDLRQTSTPARQDRPIEPGAVSPVPFWDHLARLAWGAAVVLIPWRLHFVLLARPFPPVYHGYTDLIVYPGGAALLIALFAAALACLRAQRRRRLGPPPLSPPPAGVLL